MRATKAKRARAIRVFRPEGEAVIALNEARQYTFGRADSADITFDEPRVSRHHGILRFESAAWKFEDLRSANASFWCNADELRAHLVVEENYPGLADDVDDGSTLLELKTLTDPETAHGSEIEGLAVLPVQKIGPRELQLMDVGDAVFLGTKRVGFELLDEVPEGAVGSLLATTSGASGELAEKIEIAARTSLPVLLLGPSGAGKTSTAWQIHQQGRPKGAFVVVNCAALQDDATWLRSALLGQVKDAFAGAQERIGKFFEADQGTLFLDEVESLPSEAQGFLLSLLDTNKAGDLAKLGGTGRPAARPEVRVISASKVPLTQTTLREDLCWRLGAGHAIVIPPLSERRGEIPALIRNFVRDLAGMKGQPEPRLSEGALRYMREMEWPGQIRQLESAVRAIVDTVRARAAIRGSGNAQVIVTVDHVKAWEREQLAAFGSGAPPADKKTKSARSLTRDDVIEALEACEWNVVQTAKHLGVAARTVYNKMERFGIERRD